MSNWRLGVGLLAAAGYAGLSHALMLHAADRPWAVAALFGPLLLAVGGLGLRRRHLPTLTLTLLGVGVLVTVVLRGGVGDVNKLYVLQHAGIHLALCWSFALSLRPGAVPMISGIAARVHGGLTPAMAAYTRRLTQVWAGYFLVMTGLSCWIYGALPWSMWSFFANIATPLSAGLLFVGEYVVRYVLHPEFERASLADAVRAYSHSGASAPETAGPR